ncbi:MAG TPA: hypothetical protein DCF66_06390 [Lachnospiraceae bacterium]|nr:hypothetical protein [Lachnospiraceae bacterium]
MKVLKKIGIGFLILMAITYFFNALNTPGGMSVYPQSTPQQTRRGVTTEQIAQMIDDSCKQVWDGNYETKLDSEHDIFQVNVWSYDIDADLIERTKQGENITFWNNMVKDLKSNVSTMQNSFNELNHDEITCVLNLCDPINRDVVYLSIAQGVAGYDAVNGIDLLNNPDGNA